MTEVLMWHSKKPRRLRLRGFSIPFFVGGIGIGVGFLIFLGASKVFEFYTDDYADTLSLAVFLISLAVSVYFAEPIRAVIPINLLLLLILVHIVYVLIRWYVKGCKRSRGYY